MITKRKVAYASSWSALTLILSTILQLGKSVYATRVLDPADFGIIAIVFAFHALLNQLSFFGVDAALIQKKNLDEGDLDLAWTFEFVRKNLIVLIILFVTPFLASWIDDSRILWACPVVAFGLFISSFQNYGMVVFRREMTFRNIFYIDVLSVLTQVTFVIAGLMIWKSIVVILMGAVVLSLSQVFISYLLHDHRPRFYWHKERLKGLLAFGSCLLGNTIVRLIEKQGITFALARFAGVAILGFYNRGYVFSIELFHRIEIIIWRVCFPLFSSNHHSADGLAGAYKSLTALILLFAPAALGCYFVAAPDLIPWLLSARWNESIIFVQLFCVQSLLNFLINPTALSFQAIGRPILHTLRKTTECVLFLGLLYPSVMAWGVKGVVIAGIISRILILPSYLLKARDCVVPFRFMTFVRWIVPSLISATVMITVYLYISSKTSTPMIRIFGGGGSSILSYLVVYAVTVFILAKGQLMAIMSVFPRSWQQRFDSIFSS